MIVGRSKSKSAPVQIHTIRSDGEKMGPVRQTVSIVFQQPVTLYRGNSKVDRVKHFKIEKGFEKPRQLFWRRRLLGNVSCLIERSSATSEQNATA